jgi:ABC-2 type transport system permease protein
MFGSIFRFEVNYHRRQFLFYILCAVFFLLTFLATTSDNVSIGPTFSNVNINAPIAVISTLATLSILSLFGAVAFVANGVVRDYDLKTAELFLTTNVTKFEYLYGRFFGALIFSFGIYFAGLLGVAAGELAPWLDQERIAEFNWGAYWFASWAIVLPNLFFMSCIFFCLATVTRSMMSTYVAAIAFLMMTFVMGSFTEPETVELVSKIEPFGLTALGEQTRYWTVFEKNELIPAMEGNFLINRALWLAIGLFFLGLAYRLFPFSVEKVSLGRKSKNKVPNDVQEQVPTQVEFSLPHVTREFGLSANLAQYFSQTRIEFRNIVRSAPFIVLMLLGVLNVLGATAGSLDNMFGTPVYPTTATFVAIINGTLALSLIGVLVYYSGEVMLKERVSRFSEIVDSLPYPNWVMMMAKLSGLILVIVSMLMVSALTAISVQLYNGYYELDLLVYAQGLLVFYQFPLYFTCVASLFFFVMTRSRYITMFLVVLYIVSLIALPQLGFEHYLYRMDTPSVIYSIFTGYTHLIEPFLWYTLYWSLWGFLLLVMIHLFWPRGSEFTLKSSMAVARQRFTGTVGITSALVIVALTSTGGFIYYNTTVLNPYVTNLEQEERASEYEKTYKKHQYQRQPNIIETYAEVDIFPEEREVFLKGHYKMVNDSQSPIEELHFTRAPGISISSLEVPGSVLTLQDDDFGFYIYRLEPPLQPGDTLKVDFSTQWLTPGFMNNGASMKLTQNGTFFNNLDVFPIPGYQSDWELQDNAKRRKYELEPIQRMRKIDNREALEVNSFGTSGRTEFETVVSTSKGQRAIAPGYLQKTWEEGDRAYFHYKMDEPIWGFFSFLSADYEVQTDQWNDVAIEVYYKHDYNVERMIYATKKSLEYFEANFTPYQYRQFRILEFPRYQGVFAQSFPNTIPFSEQIGFVADLTDKKDIDYVYYVTAHELAHQWWAHQVLGADVQGQTMIVETLAQYFALMVMKKEYGEDTMKKFLKFELDRYLNGRGGELIEELPLSMVENQQYIHYRKGSVALYALQDYVGEDVVNQALKSFLEKNAFQGPPYPTALDLIQELRVAAGPEHDALITDLLEKIILFDLKVEEVKVAELADGQFEVTMELSLAKFEADGEGKETEIDVDGLFDIALLGEKDVETDVYNVIQISKHEIKGNSHRISIITDTKPYAVGIDPFNKLVDRNPDDNIKNVDP